MGFFFIFGTGNANLFYFFHWECKSFLFLPLGMHFLGGHWECKLFCFSHCECKLFLFFALMCPTKYMKMTQSLKHFCLKMHKTEKKFLQPVPSPKKSKFVGSWWQNWGSPSNKFYQNDLPVSETFNLKFNFQTCFLLWYSDLPNNHAANLINFLKNSNLHGLIPSCTFINTVKPCKWRPRKWQTSLNDG